MVTNTSIAVARLSFSIPPRRIISDRPLLIHFKTKVKFATNINKTIIKLKKYTKNENVIEKIHEEICKRNSWFNDLRVLRQLEKNEPKMLNYIYESIFNNYILHIDITALEYLSNLFTNVECGEKELLNCARALDFASELYVRNLFSKNTMLEEFSEKSGIERENALFFIELI